MKICITPSSLKLFGTYVNRQLSDQIKSNKSAPQLIADLFELGIKTFSNTELTETENKEIVLQHMSIVPQIVLKHLAENPTVKFKDEPGIKSLASEVLQASEDKSSSFEKIVNRFGSIVGNQNIKVPEKDYLDRFEAISYELFKTANQEAIWNEKDGYSKNIQNQSKVFEFGVSREIIKSKNSNLYQFKLTTLGALTAMEDFVDTTGLTEMLSPMLVLVNNKNEIVKFNAEGIEDVNGQIPGYSIKTTEKSLIYQKTVIAEQYEDKGLSRLEAKKKASVDVNDFINYIKESAKSKTPIYLSINVGQSSLGFIAINRNKTTNLSDVINLNTEEAPLGKEFTGKQFYPVIKPKNSSKTFPVYSKALSTLTDDEFEMLHYLLTASEVKAEGYKSALNNNTRKKFISYFVQERPGVFAFTASTKKTAVKESVQSTIQLGNEVIDSANLTLEKLKEWANQRQSKPVSKAQLTEGTVVKESIDLVTNLGEFYYGKDGKVYESVGVRRSFSDERAMNMDDFILGGSKVPVKLEDGVLKVGNKKTLRDQVTSVGYTNVVLNGDNKIIAMGSYLKFEKGVNTLADIIPKAGEIKFRSISTRNKATQANAKQNDAAISWFKSSPLYDIIKLNFINGVSEQGPNFVANFINDSINLFEGSSGADVYHEAFHAFFDGILSVSERTEIYGALRKQVGTFNTTVNGKLKTISWSQATEIEIEEYLAEEFREFALSDGKNTKISDSKIVAFFQKLLNLLKSVFGDMTYVEAKALNKTNALVDVLFNSLYKGEFTSDMFTARTSEAKWKSEEIDTTSGDEFSLEEISLVMESMQSLLSEFITNGLNISENIEDKQNAVKYMQLMAENLPSSELYQSAAKAFENLSNSRLRTGSGAFMIQKNPKILNLALNFVKARFQQELDLINEQLKSSKEAGESISLKYNKEILEKVLKEENFGTLSEVGNYLEENQNKEKTNSTLLGTYLNNYSNLNISEVVQQQLIDEVVEDVDENTETWEVLWNRGGQELMLDKTLSTVAVDILSSVRAYTKQGKGNPMINPIGIQRMLPFKNTLAKVARLVANTVDAQEMAEKLKVAAVQDKELAQILNRLGDITDLKHSAKLSMEEHKQWTSFWQSLNKSDVILQEFILANEIKISSEEEITASLTAKVGKAQSEDLKIDRQWASNFKFILMEEGNPAIENRQGLPVYNLKKLYDDWINPSQGSFYGKISGDGPQFVSTSKEQGTGVYTRNRKSLAEADPIGFLAELGIEIVEESEVMEILFNEKNEHGTPLIAYLVDNIKNRLTATTWNALEGMWEPNSALLTVKSLNEVFVGFKYKDATGKIQDQSEIFGVKKGLRELQYQYADQYTSFSSRNAKGELQSEKSFNSSLLMNVHAINAAQSIEDVFNTPGLEHLNPAWNPQVLASNWLTTMFQLGSKYDTQQQGKRDVAIKVHVQNLSGNKLIQQTEISTVDIETGKTIVAGSIENDKGESQISSDLNTKMIGDFYLTLNGKQEIMRTEAKSTALTVFTTTKIAGESKTRKQLELAINVNEIEQLVKAEYSGQILLDRFRGHIINDIVRIQRTKELQRQIKSGEINGKEIAIDVAQLNRGTNWMMFDFLSTELKEKLLKQNILDTWNTPSAIPQKLVQQIEKELRTEFMRDAQALYSEFADRLPLAQETLDFYTKDTVEGVETETQQQVVAKMFLSFIANNFLSNADYSATFLGDSSIYDLDKEAYHKRIAGLISTGNIIRRDDAWLQLVNSEEFGNEAFAKKHNARFNRQRDYTYSGKLNTGVMKEIISQSVFREQYEALGLDVKDYNEMEEADGQGWISFDAYRLLNMSIDEWSDKQEYVYQKMLNDEPLTRDDMKTTFPVRKFQYYGSVMNAASQAKLRDAGFDFASMAFHKYSLMPLVPEVIKNSPKLVELHESMMENGLAYVTMNSGSKLSTLTKVEYSLEDEKFVAIEDEFYKADRSLNVDMLDSETPWTLNTIDVMNLKSQIFIKEGYKGYITLPTQLRKMAIIGVLDNGVPFDYTSKQTKKDATLTVEQIEKKWEALSPLQKRKQSKKWAWYQDFTETLDEMQSVLRDELLKDIQMKEVKNSDGTISYEGDSVQLVEYIKSQLKDKELLPEEINYIAKEDGTLIDDLSFSLIGSKIEELLVTLVDKKLRRLRTKGEKLTQVSSAMWENYDWKTGTEEDHVKYGTSGLKFHFAKDKNGKYIKDPVTGNFTVTEMEVKISLQGDYVKLFNTKHSDGKRISVYTKDVAGNRQLDYDASLKRLNESIKDEAWLVKYGKMIDIPGVRIPSQGSNSFIATRIAEFLPESAGTILIMPSEVVVNTGSDYDVDAMFTLMKSLISKYGRTEEVKYIPNQKEDEIILFDAIDVLEKTRAEIVEQKQELYQKYFDYRQEKGLINDEVQVWIESIKANQLNIEESYADKRTVYTSGKYTISQKKEYHAKVDAQIAATLTNIEDAETKIAEILSQFFNAEINNKENRRELVEANHKKYNDPIKKLDEELTKIENQLFTLEAKLQGRSVKGLQNRLIDLIQERVLDPDNMVRLVAPNVTDAWEDMARDAGKKIKKTFDKTKGGNSKIFKYRFNLLKQQEMSVALDALGIAAIASTFYAVFTTFDATLQEVSEKDLKQFTTALKYLSNPNNITSVRAWENSLNIVNTFQSRTLKLPSNAVKKTNSLSLGMVENINGQQISDLLSQLISGYVDAANKPFIAEMQGNKENTPTILFLTMAGVSPRNIISMMTNPLVLEYNAEIIANKGIFGTAVGAQDTEQLDAILNEQINEESRPYLSAEAKALKSVYEEYEDLEGIKDAFDKTLSLNTILNRATEFSEKELEGRIGEDVTFRDFEVLAQFIAAKTMAEQLNEFQQLTKFDTVKISSISAAQDRQEAIKEFKSISADKRVIPNAWFEKIAKSPIGAFDNDQFIIDLFARYFGVKNNPALILKSLGVKVPKGVDKQKVLTEFKDDFIWFLYQNAVYATNTYTTSSTSVVDNKIAAPGKTYTLKESNSVSELTIDEETGAVIYPKNLLLLEQSFAEFAPIFKFFNNNNSKEYVKFRIEFENLKRVSENMTHEEFTEAYGIFDYSSKSYFEQGETIGRSLILNKVALYNTGNVEAMFDISTGVSSILRNLNSKYKSDLENFAFFRDIKFDYNEPLAKMNMHLPQIQDAQMAKVYRENIAELKNSPHAEVRDFFGKFDHMVIMQTGLTLKSKYALTKLINQNLLEDVIESSIGVKYVNGVLEDINDLIIAGTKREEIDGQIIDQFANMFSDALDKKAMKVRGHNYTVDKLSFAKVKKAKIKKGTNKIFIVQKSEANEVSSIPLLTSDMFFASEQLTPKQYSKGIKSKAFRIINAKYIAADASQQDVLDEALLVLGVDNSGLLPRLVAQKKDGSGLSIERSKIAKPLYSINDEAMANRATKAIAKPTAPLNPQYKSSTAAYVEALSTGEYKDKNIVADRSSRKKQFDAKDVVWIFGSGVFSNAYESEGKEKGREKFIQSLKTTFESYHEPLIKKAIKENVQTFVVGNATGIDSYAKVYLEANGYSPVKQYTAGGVYYEMVKNENLKNIVAEYYAPAESTVFVSSNPVYNMLFDEIYEVVLNEKGQDNGKRKQNEAFGALTLEERELEGYDTVKRIMINAIKLLDKSSKGNVSYRSRLAYELKNSSKGLMTYAKSQENLFDSLVEQVLMEFRNAAQTVGPVKKLKSKLDESVYDSLGVKDYNDIFELGLLLESKKETIIENFGNKFKSGNPLSYINESIADPKISNEEIIEQLKKCY
jgi:hypothetical protein